MKKRMISIALVLALLVQILPTYVFAEDDASDNPLVEAVEPGVQEPGLVVLGEMTDRRGESEKHFRMNDGSFIAVDYGMPVHYTTDGGNNWVEIDNTLALTQADESPETKMAGRTRAPSYVAENGDNATGFAADLRDGYLFSSKAGVYSLNISLSDNYFIEEACSLDGEATEIDADAVMPAEAGAPSEMETAETAATSDEKELSVTAETSAEATEAFYETEEAAIEESFDKTEDADVTESHAETMTAEAAKASDDEETTEVAKAFEEKEDSHTTAPVEELTEPFSRSAVAEISYPASESTQSITSPIMQAYEEMKGNFSFFGNEKNSSEQSIAEQIAVKKLYAEVLYRSVYQDVDLRYALNGYNIKETIVVNRPKESYSFSFYLDIPELTPIQMEDGSVELRNERDEVVYLIPAPFMTDANGAYSEDAFYKLSESKSGAWQLTVVADENWINDTERAFPVEIDPTLYLWPDSTYSHIYTTYVQSDAPNTAYPYHAIFCSGYYNNVSTVGLLYFNDLPKIPEHCVVTDARFMLSQIQGGDYKGGSFNQKLYATTVSNPSDPYSYMRNMTWNQYQSEIEGNRANLGGTNGATVLDCHIEKKHTYSSSTYVITNAAQRWYDSNDSSISRLIVLDTEINSTAKGRAVYGGCDCNSFPQYYPVVFVTYRNVVGIEGIYGYHTQNIGRAGTGYVNDFTLQSCLAVPIASAPSGTLPFGISLYYNGGLSCSQFTSSTTLALNYSNIHTLPYTNAKTGYGWKTSLQQTVRYVLYDLDGDYTTEYDQSKWLIYTDADGTEHYFYKTDTGIGTIYKDEDGLGLTIRTQGLDLYTMTDKEDNTWEFSYGYLTKYTDNHGNKLFYAYDGSDYTTNNNNWKPNNNTSAHRVTGVWRQNDGGTLQKVATLTYNGSGYLTEIKDAANRATTLTYNSSGCLTKLTYPDSKTASYSYSAQTLGDKTYYRISQACDNESNYRIEYAYREGKPLQVLSITERAKDDNGSWEYGQRANCYLSSADHASFRYFDASDYNGSSYNTTGKLITQHYFDNWGRTVNIVTQEPNTEEVLGVSTGTYTKNDSVNAKNNRLTNSASAGIEASNLLQNADLEYVENGGEDVFFGWTKVGTGFAAPRTNSGTGTLVNPHLGNYLMKIYQANGTVGEYRVEQSVYLEKDKTYVFSAYVNTACTESFGNNGGVYLTFRQGASLKAKSRVIDYKTSAGINGGWERIDVAFTPTVSGTYAVAANVYSICNIAVVDDLKLEKIVVTGAQDVNNMAGTASVFNLLQADSFEFRNAATGNYEATNVNKWWHYATSEAGPCNTQANTGSYSLTFAPCMTDTSRATQTVQINDSSNKTYILSAWGLTPPTSFENSEELEEDNINECRFFGLIAEVNYTDGSTPDYHYVSFNGDIPQWQFASGVIVPKQSDKIVSTITVSACLDYCANRSYMDDITLI